MPALTLAEIKEQYPDQWVLIGDPELRKPEVGMSIPHNLVRAVVLFASEDPRELIVPAHAARGTVQRITYFHTGEPPKGRRYMISVRRIPDRRQ